MKVDNIYSGMDIKWLNKISQDYSEYYLKNKKEVLEVKKKYDRFNSLIIHNKSLKIKDKLSLKKIEELSEMSKSMYYRINKEIKDKGLTYWTYYYRKNSTRPINLRKSKIIDYNNNINNRKLIDTIKDIRNNNPTYSKYKIHFILNRDYRELIDRIIYSLNSNSSNNNSNNTNNKFKYIISISTIGRILSYLKNNNLVKKYCSYRKNNNKLNKTRNFNNCYAKPWNFEEHFIGSNNINRNILNNKTKMNKLNRLKNNNKFIDNISDNNKIHIGDLIQIDHMIIRKNNLNIRLFNAIDPITRITVSKAYSSANSKNAKDFLINKVLKLFPFKVNSIQVDGGSEFMKHFEEGCKENNIPLYVLPPRSPKYNGRIERFNKTIRDEELSNKDLFNNINTMGDFNLLINDYVYKYNNYRPHSALDNLTPMEYFNKYKSENEGSFSQMM